MCHQDQAGIVQTGRHEARIHRQLSSAGPTQFYSMYLSSLRQKPHSTWALAIPVLVVSARQPNFQP